MEEYQHVLNDDPSAKWTHRGDVLDKSYIKMRFRVTLFFIYVFEVFALAWPITATWIYKTQAFLTWPWFIYIVRVILLFIPFITYENIRALVGADGYKGWLNKMRVPAAMRPSFTLWLWAWLSTVACGLFGSLLTVATIPCIVFFSSYVLWGLTLAFSFIFTVESISAVFILYYHGVYYCVRSKGAKPVRIINV